MIINIRVKNFGILKDVSLNFPADTDSDDSKFYHHNRKLKQVTSPNLDSDVIPIPVVGLYGQNGSGKTTFIKAVKYLCDVVKTKKVLPSPYLSDETAEFAIMFGKDGILYDYGLAIQNGKIVDEYLDNHSTNESYESGTEEIWQPVSFVGAEVVVDFLKSILFFDGEAGVPQEPNESKGEAMARFIEKTFYPYLRDNNGVVFFDHFGDGVNVGFLNNLIRELNANLEHEENVSQFIFATHSYGTMFEMVADSICFFDRTFNGVDTYRLFDFKNYTETSKQQMMLNYLCGRYGALDNPFFI